jgi:hypothetical protein
MAWLLAGFEIELMRILANTLEKAGVRLSRQDPNRNPPLNNAVFATKAHDGFIFRGSLRRGGRKKTHVVAASARVFSHGALCALVAGSNWQNDYRRI